MDRYLLIFSTLCFLAAVVHTAIELRAGVFRPMRFNFFAICLGFIFQTAFLSVRGHELGRCPLTNLFEVFIFLAWSVAAIYMLVGPGYRLSLMGAFTAPLVVVLQVFALIAPIGIILGRFGCLLHGCCQGIECSPSWFTLKDQSGIDRWPAVPAEITFNLSAITLFYFGRSGPAVCPLTG